MKKSVLFFALCAIGGSSLVSANELALTSDNSKRGGGAHSVDFFSNGDGVALEVRIEIPGGDGASVDVSKCGKALPKTHTGSCVFNGKELVILAYSMENARLPAGVIDLGSFSVTGGISKELGTPAVSKFIVGSADGVEINAKVISPEAAETFR